MKLQVGLTAPHPGWQLFLDQERVASSFLPANGPWKREETPVILVTRTAGISGSALRHFLQQGGRLVADSSSAEALNEFGLGRDLFRADADLSSAASDWQYQDKIFNNSSAHPVLETCAKETKRKARAALREAICQAFWAQGLPYGHLAYYPHGFRSIFSFRFDFDEYDPADFNELCRLLDTYRGSVTCFPCLKTYENRLDELKRAVETGVEFGSHAYVHHVYSSEAQNEANLKRAEELLGSLIPRVSAFSGPHGTWHPSLQRVLEKRSYDYSSEFSLDYDNLPFFPLLENRPSAVLQIPVHPVCEGVFLQAYPYHEEVLRSYYDRVVAERAAAGLPILIFGHPTRRIGRYPAILHNIYQALSREQGIWKTEFRTYAAWWRLRHRFAFSAFWSPEAGLQLETAAGSKDTLPHAGKIAFCMEYSDGRVEVHTFEKRQPPVFETRAAVPLLEAGAAVRYPPVKRLRRFLKKALDWETKTPLPLLRVTGPASALKWALRLPYDKICKTAEPKGSMERKSPCASARS